VQPTEVTGAGGTSGAILTVPPLQDAGVAGAGCDEELDVVFVMDVSTSMTGMLDALADQILAVDAAAKKLELPSPPRYGLVVFVDDALIVNAGKAFENAGLLQSEFKKWAAFTNTNRQVVSSGENSTYTENSIDALYLAASKFEWRPSESTLRMLIHTTDDTFAERPQNLDGIAILHTYAEVAAELQKQHIRLFAFAATLGGNTGTDDVSPGWFAPHAGSPALPDLTGGRAFQLRDVPSKISLAASIPQAVAETRCKPYPDPK
jgi:hypothetical protein